VKVKTTQQMARKGSVSLSIRDLGTAAMDNIDLDTTSILLTMLDITNDDLMAEGKLSEADLEAL
jgi:hypothetical protein